MKTNLHFDLSAFEKHCPSILEPFNTHPPNGNGLNIQVGVGLRGILLARAQCSGG